MNFFEGPYTRAALRVVRDSLPTMVVWAVAVSAWLWWSHDVRWLAIVGLFVLTLPYFLEWRGHYRRFMQRVRELDELYGNGKDDYE